ncbi:hypothetical protein FACS1894201_06240 [Bacteroidia bacterium]|nr:hypothetical protein FACS1894201_06240 [Bacteroidia bacterium]
MTTILSINSQSLQFAKIVKKNETKKIKNATKIWSIQFFFVPLQNIMFNFLKKINIIMKKVLILAVVAMFVSVACNNSAKNESKSCDKTNVEATGEAAACCDSTAVVVTDTTASCCAANKDSANCSGCAKK